MARRALQQREIRPPRAVEIPGEGQRIRIACEIGELDRAERLDPRAPAAARIARRDQREA